MQRSSVNFRCDDPNHGQSYLTNQQTEEEIRQLKVKEVTNILVLGKTGVGKTTWINAIAKYLLYDTLKDAIDSKDYTACIPAKFSQTTEEGDTVTIAIGDWDKSPDELNERGELGKSSTKKPKSYYFDFDDKNQVRIIDTPGIVDTAGIEKDKENLELILDHISHFNNINGICILLPPNDSREGIEMRFCIGELLTHLHKSAAENIMFCFTKCHETFFKPGETLPVLKRFLANLKDVDIAATRNNCFYFENDSFRLLSCLQNGIEFNEKIIENYSPSWDHSATEAARLFKYVCKLKPHSTNETISLNKTRKWIVGMNKPMALIQANISNRIKLRNSKKQELTGIQEEVENLKDKLEFEFSMPFVIPLDHPKTVCYHESCTKKIKVGNDAKLEPIKSCHDPCDLNVRADVMGESSLRGCKCMKNWRVFDGDECNVCHHSYEHHLHIRYNVGFKTEKATDKKVQEMLERNESQSKIIEEAIKNFERENKTDEEELNTILNISAQFACFLKRFAISTFNDGVYSYLELLIDEQKKLENNEKMNELIRMRDQYEIQKNIIEKAIKNSNGERSDKFISTPEEAEALKEKLFLFEINGQLFKKMSEDIAKIELNFAFKESRVFLRKQVGKKFNGIFKTG
ncbi:uncharacterized protein [Clytia hemisphaerica]|uniref:uncharacterized protein n=1 Tax=Clytia hemisphaerica TaxID=252671 RepID=UPI0034D77C87